MEDVTALLEAARCDDLGELQRLVEAGVPVDVLDDEGRSPLYLAAAFSAPALVRLLLRAGADPRFVGQAGITVLHRAAISGHPLNAQLLLEAGCPPDAADEQGRTALMMGPGPNGMPGEATDPEDANHVDPLGVATALLGA